MTDEQFNLLVQWRWPGSPMRATSRMFGKDTLARAKVTLERIFEEERPPHTTREEFFKMIEVLVSLRV